MSAKSNTYECVDFTTRLAVTVDTLVQKVNQLHGREAAIRACIAELRRSLSNCNGNTRGACAPVDLASQMQSLIRFEQVVNDIDAILLQPC